MLGIAVCCFNCPALREFRKTDTMAYLGIMPLQQFNACGDMTLVHLRTSLKICMDAHSETGLQSQASDQPQVAGNDVLLA